MLRMQNIKKNTYHSLQFTWILSLPPHWETFKNDKFHSTIHNQLHWLRADYTKKWKSINSKFQNHQKTSLLMSWKLKNKKLSKVSVISFVDVVDHLLDGCFTKWCKPCSLTRVAMHYLLPWQWLLCKEIFWK